MSNTKQTINFTFDHRALSTIIGEQAGSLQKALLECIMNSADAGASEVNVTLDKYRYVVIDDGRGITDINVIENFFETFGTPHQEGDATFGVHRIGRGQSFMFSAVTWRTGTFKMFVDVKANGFNHYELTTGMEPVTGCQISGELYDTLTPTELLSCVRELTALCRYVPIRVILNGKLISVDPATEEWTKVTDDAYIRITKRHDLKIYNLGALVKSVSNSFHGCGGVIVSRKQLALNWARNDVLLHECEVWPRILTVVGAETERYNKTDTDKISVSSEAYKAHLANAIMHSPTILSAEVDEKFAKAKLFTDIQGSNYSLVDLASFKSISSGSKVRIDHAKVHVEKSAVVMANNAIVSRFKEYLPDVLLKLSQFIKADGSSMVSTLASKALSVYADIKTFTTDDDSFLIIPEENIPVYAQTALVAIQSLSDEVAALVGIMPVPVGLMDSETVRMAMDEEGILRINRKHFFATKGDLDGPLIPNVAIGLLQRFCEYSSNDNESAFHDEEYYENVFRFSEGAEFRSIVARHFKSWIAGGIDGSLGNKMLKMCDVVHRHDEITKQLTASGQ